MDKAMALTLAALLLLAACGSGDPASATPAEPTPAIADAPTPIAKPLPTATPAPTAEPTAEPEAPAESVDDDGSGAGDVSEDEAAVIAAWERYLDLSTQALGKAPSSESLDYQAYAMGGALQGLSDASADGVSNQTYITGTARSAEPSIQFVDGSALVEACVQARLEKRDLEDDKVLVRQDEERVAVARLEFVSGRWLIAAFETRVLCAD